MTQLKDFFGRIEQEQEPVVVANIIVPRKKSGKVTPLEKPQETFLECPYDLEYCDETIAAYKRFEEHIKKCLETNSEILIPQHDGWTTDLPPCETETRAKCPRYLAWQQKQQKTK
jgi:hypothetical protein